MLIDLLYSPDLASPDSHVFLSLSNRLVNSFSKDDDLNQWLEDFFASNPKTFDHEGIHNLPGKWKQMIRIPTDYLI